MNDLIFRGNIDETEVGSLVTGMPMKITIGALQNLNFEANLEYISSAGLRLVIAAYKKMAGKEGFRIVNVSDEVYDVFSLTGFDQKINIEKK